MYDVERMKWGLLSRYEGEKIDEVFNGRTFENSMGNAFLVEKEEHIEFQIPDEDEAKEQVLSNLQLIYGIGSKTEEGLKDSGISNLKDLKERDGSYREEVEEVLKTLEKRDIRAVQERVGRWFNKGHPLFYSTAGLVDKEDILFFDIETLGLENVPVFLIGVGRFVNGEFRTRQYLARDLKEEDVIIEQTAEELERCEYLVSFNGSCFDLRFLSQRAEVHDIELDIDRAHLDLLPLSREAVPDVPDHRLQTLESHVLGNEREDDVPSSVVPHFYEIHLQKENYGPLVPIIKHNREDVTTLALLLDEMRDICIG